MEEEYAKYLAEKETRGNNSKVWETLKGMGKRMFGKKVSVVFLGATDSGKSTLLNQLVGKQVFNSGYGAPIKKEVAEVTIGNVSYIEIPEFEDVVETAVEVQKILDLGGICKFFFVLNTAWHGRLIEDSTRLLGKSLSKVIPFSDCSIIVNYAPRDWEKYREEYCKNIQDLWEYHGNSLFFMGSILESNNKDLVEFKSFVENAPSVC